MTTTVRLPLELRNPRVASLAGNSYFTVNGLTATDLGVWRFTNGVDGKIYGVVLLPNNLNGTPNANIGFAFMANATSNAARWAVSTKAVANGSSLNPGSLTAETAQNITVPGTANLRTDVTFPTSGNIGETVAANNILLVEIARVGSNAGDTLTVPADLVAAWLQVDLT